VSDENGDEVADFDILDDVSLEALGGIQSVDQVEQAQPEPLMESPEWPGFVMQQFTEDELDNNGNPYVHGLRRVSRKLLGPPIVSAAKSIQPPALLNNLDQLGILQVATVEYTLTIKMIRTESLPVEAYDATFVDVADVYFGNTDPDFARHASAMGATRAEARCYRKALQLRGIASEESTVVPTSNAGLDGKITPEQLNFMKILCARKNVNVIKFINFGKHRYESIGDIPFGTAQKMNQHLSTMQSNDNIPDAIRGYDKNWENE
jgi:hypothetical protein